MKKYHVLLTLVMILMLSSHVFGAPQRIVSLTPSTTELVFAVGVGDRLVGVTAWCDYPPEAQEIPVIGDAFNLNLEVLLNLEPDLIIGDANLVGRYVEKLNEVGIEVYSVTPNSVQEVIDSLIDLGELLGNPELGRQAATRMEEDIQSLLNRVPGGPSPRVFVETWSEPLSTVGPGSFIHEIVDMAGGINIAEDAKEPYAQFSEEQVIARDPEVILLTNYNKEEVLGRSAWQDLSAVQKGQVFEINPDLFVRGTPRLVDGLRILIELFHPLACDC